MATIAGDTSVYNAQTDWENERKYLSGLAKGGNAWAVDQLGALAAAEKMYTQPSKPVAPSVSISTPVRDQSAMIEQLYKAQQDAALAELEAAYNQNVIDLDAAAGKITGIYRAERNRAASDAAVNQRNFDEYAAASGLGSGANAQARLAMNNQLTSGLSPIAQAEADANANIETERAKVKAEYKSAVAKAIAEGNASKAQALYAEAVRMDEMLQQQAVQNAQLALQQAELERALFNDEYARAQAAEKQKVVYVPEEEDEEDFVPPALNQRQLEIAMKNAQMYGKEAASNILIASSLDPHNTLTEAEAIAIANYLGW